MADSLMELNENLPRISYEQPRTRYDILNKVVSDLESKLDQSKIDELNQSIPIAVKLLDDMQLEPQSLDIDNPQHIEQITLLLAIAYSSQIDNNGYDNEIIRRQSLLIFGEKIKNKEFDQYRNDNSQETWEGVYKDVLMYFWGSEFKTSNEDDFYKWIKKTKVRNNVLELPINLIDDSKEFKQMYQDIWDKNKVPKDKQKIVTAVAITEHGFAIVQKGAKKWVVDHELSHLENDGLLIGSLGDAINETLTELHAGIKCNKRDSFNWNIETSDGLSKFLGMFSSSYAEAKDMFTQMIRCDHNLLSLFISRYCEISQRNSLDLRVRLINDFGLEMYSKIYLAHGNVTKAGSDSWSAKLIYPRILRDRLYDINDELKRPTEW